MRETRFRAYIKKSRKMVSVSVLRLQGWMIGNDGDSYNEDEYVLMQYTGLKDKNGKEIYEGDIIVDLQISPVCGNKRVIRNFIEDGYFLAKELEDNERNIFEVIGNIYENPKLMEDK